MDEEIGVNLLEQIVGLFTFYKGIVTFKYYHILYACDLMEKYKAKYSKRKCTL